MTIEAFNLNRHHCDLAVVKCIDFRFRETDQQFIHEQFGVQDFDLIAWPGASKSIVHDEVMREKKLATIKNVCCGLHNVKKLVILNHWDCGGYGGSKAFATPEAELEAYKNDLTRVSLEGRHYCDNAAITCVDFRFRIPDQEFLTSYFGTEDYDLFRWPGPARSTLLDPRFKDRLVERIKQVCIGLHQVKRFVVLLHWDCGAYGGSRSFTTSQAEETAYINDALKVKETLQRACPWVTVEVAYSHHHDGQLTYRLL